MDHSLLLTVSDVVKPELYANRGKHLLQQDTPKREQVRQSQHSDLVLQTRERVTTHAQIPPDYRATMESHRHPHTQSLARKQKHSHTHMLSHSSDSLTCISIIVPSSSALLMLCSRGHFTPKSVPTARRNGLAPPHAMCVAHSN